MYFELYILSLFTPSYVSATWCNTSGLITGEGAGFAGGISTAQKGRTRRGLRKRPLAREQWRSRPALTKRGLFPPRIQNEARHAPPSAPFSRPSPLALTRARAEERTGTAPLRSSEGKKQRSRGALTGPGRGLPWTCGTHLGRRRAGSAAGREPAAGRAARRPCLRLRSERRRETVPRVRLRFTCEDGERGERF